ncbi:hypothetical protein EGW08_012826 [Elysia chlorotica]|uniref:Carboxylic ester hydrolase n=1 Tax=Elysia chlorotica TaxID=188477 RepID=A0A3S1A090_ELYCH|nr:hypothetical protein EGW08_012826 [Elysia chlorotica]
MPAGQEDCLFLNVFLQRLPIADTRQAQHSESTSTSTSTTRNPTMTTAGAKKKVLVWVHGGGFIAGGASDYPPGSFVTSQDVILVSVNYRLGVLGFLSTENQAGPGNYGMWDQVMALRWVKENIAAFGGDPDDVTISGESAGGSAVSFLSLSPWARGLFTKVYPMSGAATSVFAIALGAQDHAAEIGRSTGCLGKDLRAKLSLAQSEDLMECLRGLSLEEITKLSPFTLERAQFVPRVDGDFLPLHPSKLLRDDLYLESIGFFNRTYLLSVTNSERAIMQGAVDSLELGINSQEDVSEEDKAAQIKRLHDSTYGFYLGARVALPCWPR